MKNGLHSPDTVKDRSREKSMLSNTIISLSQMPLMVRCCPVGCDLRVQFPFSDITRFSSIGLEMMYSRKKPLSCRFLRGVCCSWTMLKLMSSDNNIFPSSSTVIKALSLQYPSAIHLLSKRPCLMFLFTGKTDR